MAEDEVPARVFRDEAMPAIVAYVRARVAAGARVVDVEVLDPDRGRGRFAGEVVEVTGERWRHRSLRVWTELADRLGMRLWTPRAGTEPRVRLRFEVLGGGDEVEAGSADPTEKYGVRSPFARVAKHEDPDFVIDLGEALERVGLAADGRVLELGVNRGDVLAMITAQVPGLAERGTIVGVDHCRSALAVARGRFPRARFVAADLAALAGLELGVFDLIVAIDTLQSSGLDDRALLRQLVQEHLAPRGAVILGLPNCRYVDGEVVHGARMLNFRQPELGLLIKDAAFYRRYLQQHGRTVFVTGKHEVLITAVPIGGTAR